jgi:hypothetical protein
VLIKKVRELSVPAQIEYLATSAPDMAGGMLAAMLELIRAHLPVRPQGLDSQTAEGLGEPAGTLELCCMDVEERFPQLARAITDQHLALLNPQQVTHLRKVHTPQHTAVMYTDLTLLLLRLRTITASVAVSGSRAPAPPMRDFPG